MSLAFPALADPFPELNTFTSNENHVLDVVLIAKETQVTVGNEVVKSNVYVACYEADYDRDTGDCKPAGTGDQRQLYAGPHLRVRRGDHLKIWLVNKMGYNDGAPGTIPGDVGLATNLHTHGLIVRARGTGKDDQLPEDGSAGYEPDSIGDFIFEQAVSQVALLAPDGKPPSKGDGKKLNVDDTTLRYDILIPEGHPKGIFWFHPHYHGFAKEQVSGGMAGMIEVLDASDYLCTPKKGAKACEANDKIDFDKVGKREILLKDAQLTEVRAANLVDAATATMFYDQDPGFCDGLTAAPDGASWCGGNGMKWSFTVNGAEQPHWQGMPGGEVLRIQNASANITYNLCFETDAFTLEPGNAEPCRNALPFRVLSLDGVSFGASATENGDALRLRRRALLMPGSRIEIFLRNLENTDSCRGAQPTMSPQETDCPPSASWATASMHSMLYRTGGDDWPHVTLAKLDLLGEGSAVLAKNQGVMPAETTKNRDSLRSQDSDLCKSGKVRVLEGNERRRIYFAIVTDMRQPEGARERFLLGSVIVRKDEMGVIETNEDGSVIYSNSQDPSEQGQVPLSVFSHGAEGEGDISDLCVMSGVKETWELVNISKEVHNFHIHQNKFALGEEYLWGTADKMKVKTPDPVDQVDLQSSVIQLPQENPGNYIHDTIVVPRGAPECEAAEIDKNGKAAGFILPNPADPHGYFYDEARAGACRLSLGGLDEAQGAGAISVKIPFFDAQQIGKYVFHCHILEHEDLGMMASIRVLPSDGGTR